MTEPFLTYGDRSPAVKELQQLLNARGAKPPLEEDGYFGKETYNEVLVFQMVLGLKPSGRVGQDVWSALKVTQPETTPPPEPETPPNLGEAATEAMAEPLTEPVVGPASGMSQALVLSSPASALVPALSESEQALLTYGDRGATIQALQRLLNQRGATPTLVEDGYFGPVTYTEVVAFQALNRLTPNGRVDERLWQILQAREDDGEPTEQIPPDAIGTSASPEVQVTEEVILSFGERSPTIREMQQLLNEWGASPPLREDGFFGPKTYAEVTAFQLLQGIYPHGRIDTETWSALRGLRTPVSSELKNRSLNPEMPESVGLPTRKRPHLKPGDNAVAVRVLQMVLNARGALPRLAETGEFDTATRTAVLQFQQRAGLPPAGEVGDATWRHLMQGISWYPLYREPTAPTPPASTVSLAELCKTYQPETAPQQARALLWLQSQVPPDTLQKFVLIWHDSNG